MNIYVHIPFCASACDYCFYVKQVAATEAERGRYLDALEREIRHRITGRGIRRHRWGHTFFFLTLVTHSKCSYLQ